MDLDIAVFVSAFVDTAVVAKVVVNIDGLIVEVAKCSVVVQVGNMDVLLKIIMGSIGVSAMDMIE